MPRLWTKLIVVLMVAAFVATGCGKPQTPEGGANGSGSTVQQDKQATVKTYYGNAQGDQLVETTSQISYKNDSDKYLAALNALKTSPDPKLVALAQGFTFRSAVLKNGQLTVDLTIDQDGQWGAPAEELTLQALKKTMFQFNEVDRIDILVDGKQAESLMGHLDLPHPITRSS